MGRRLTSTVEIDQKGFDDAKPLIACVELQSVRLIQFDFTSQLSTQSRSEGEIELSSTSHSAAEISGTALNVTFNLRLQGHQKDVLVIGITARIQAEYSIPEGANFSDLQMKAFSKSNGMLNVWPYWREYVQTTTQRAGLPPLTLPLFRVIHKQKKPISERRRSAAKPSDFKIGSEQRV